MVPVNSITTSLPISKFILANAISIEGLILTQMITSIYMGINRCTYTNLDHCKNYPQNDMMISFFLKPFLINILCFSIATGITLHELSLERTRTSSHYRDVVRVVRNVIGWLGFCGGAVGIVQLGHFLFTEIVY